MTTNLQIPFKGESWQTSLAALGPYTSHIHIHNWTQVPGESDLTYLGEGTFDWEPVVRKLVRDLGRSVCLSVEHADHSRGQDPWVTAAKDGVYLRALRQRIMGK